MKKYAREDTHYLLYICDELRTLLVKESGERNLLEEVLKRSEEVCKQAYQKPVITVETGMELINKYKSFFFFIFQKIPVIQQYSTSSISQSLYMAAILWHEK